LLPIEKKRFVYQDIDVSVVKSEPLGIFSKLDFPIFPTMDLADVTFNQLISTAKTQFVVPIWQRVYSWETKQWTDLWDDLTNLYSLGTTGKVEHFLGPIVVKTVEEKVGEISRHIIIDGQQRLTTLLVMCALLRDRAIEAHDKVLAQEIEDSFLFNKYVSKTEYKMKLVPTTGDSEAFKSLLENHEIEDPHRGNQLSVAWEFFRDLLRQGEGKYETAKLLDCVRRLRIVTINLAAKDDPNRIFETLNSRGKELDQSDLVRNYFMMTIREEGKSLELYSTLWLPMQQSLGSSTRERLENLEEFLRHYIVMTVGDFVKEDQVYEVFQKRLRFKNEKERVEELKALRKYAGYYGRLLYPEREPNVKIRKGIERLNKLSVGVAYPFLLKVYRLYEESDPKISAGDFCGILTTIESFIVRRLFHKLPTHSLNRVFASLCTLDDKGLSAALSERLSAKESWEAQYWPSNEDFAKDIETFDLYAKSGTCRFVLASLEESIAHPEPVKLDGLTIEHIMPETPSEAWKRYLGHGWDAIHSGRVHTLSNLTLMAGPPNSMLQNSSFERKCEKWYTKSNVSLTKEVARKWKRWKEPEMKERALLLTGRAMKLWPYPTADLSQLELLRTHPTERV
jgi:uncharacterized protein with ParB-like and HNH nuclease domain